MSNESINRTERHKTWTPPLDMEDENPLYDNPHYPRQTFNKGLQETYQLYNVKPTPDTARYEEDFNNLTRMQKFKLWLDMKIEQMQKK